MLNGDGPSKPHGAINQDMVLMPIRNHLHSVNEVPTGKLVGNQWGKWLVHREAGQQL